MYTPISTQISYCEELLSTLSLVHPGICPIPLSFIIIIIISIIVIIKSDFSEGDSVVIQSVFLRHVPKLHVF